MRAIFFKAQPVKAPAKKAEKVNPDAHKDYLKDDLADLIEKPKAATKGKTVADAKAESDAKTNPLAHPNFVGLLALLKDFKAGGNFGPNNVAEGDQLAFSAGEFKGAGIVSARGKRGAVVKDKTDREHRIHWHEVTGHQPAANGKKKAKDAV